MEQIWTPKQCCDNGLDHMTHDTNLVLHGAHMDALPKSPAPWGASMVKYTDSLPCICLTK